MKIPQSGLRTDSPAWPLLQALVSYWGITSGAGNAFGTTLVCADLANFPSYVGLSVKILDGAAEGQVQPIAAYAAGTITVATPFTDAAGAVQQILGSSRFCIGSFPGGGGGGSLTPSIGLWMFGECDPAMAASTTVIVCPNLAGFPDDIFNDEFWMQVIHNDDAPGTPPEREWMRITDYVGATGTFTTDAFSVNVEADDLVAIVHESIMSIEVMGYGTLDTSSTTVPADSTRAAAYAWENDDYYKGCSLVPTSGNCRLQPRPIRTYASAAGVGRNRLTARLVCRTDPSKPRDTIISYIRVALSLGYLLRVSSINPRYGSSLLGACLPFETKLSAPMALFIASG